MLVLYIISGILLHVFMKNPESVSEESAISQLEELRKERTAYSFVTIINILTATTIRLIYLPVFIVLKALKVKSQSYMFLEFERIFEEAFREEKKTNDIRQK